MPEQSELEKSEQSEADFLEIARKRYSRAREREDDNIKEAYFDLEFRAGENQWDDETESERIKDGRPVLRVNQVPQFVRTVTGDIRQARPSIQVVAVDDEADADTADHMSGMVRYVENRSDAKDAYFKGADSQVTCGVGHWQVITEYAAESTFEQEIRIQAIEDGVSVLWDPDAVLPTREDANWCFVPVDMSHDGFREQFPNAVAANFGPEDWKYHNEWRTDDYVRVAQYWVKTPVMRRLVMHEGVVANVDELDDDIRETMEAALQVVERPGYTVERYLITDGQILEKPKASFPSRFIPIVPVWGEEIRIGRKIVRHGVVRYLRDPQRIYNYNISCDTEVIALQPKSPWLGTQKNFAKFKEMWESANRKAWSHLVYDPDSKNGNIPPQRVAPAVSSQGVLNSLQIATDNMHRVTGIYPSALGEQGNETSGKAILARERQGDTGTHVYLDNMTRSIDYTGRIVVDMIPKIYDTARTVRILGEDGRVDTIKINQPQTGDLEGIPKIKNDVTVGVYDVVTQTGPNFATKREESREGMLALMQTVPDIAPMVLDLFAKAQDWPLADLIAARVRATIPPEILQASEEEEGVGTEGEEGQPEGVIPQGANGQLPAEEPAQPAPEEIEAAKQADLAQDEVDLSEIDVAKEKDLAQAQVDKAEADAKKAQADADTAEINKDIKALELEQKQQAPTI